MTLQWLSRVVLPALVPAAALFGVMAGAVGGVIVAAWWGAIPLVVASLAVTPFFLDESVATAGMGFLFYLYAIPVLSLVFVAWAVASRRLPDGPRRLAMVATIVLACGAWTWCGVTV